MNKALNVTTQLVLVLLATGLVTLGLSSLIHEAGIPIFKGPHKLWRRLWLLAAVIGILLVLRRNGWPGWRECGWKDPDSGRIPSNALQQLLIGWGLGLLTMFLVSLPAWIGDVRIPDPESDLGGGLGRGLLYLLSGLLVGVLEETLARGIFYRALARVMPLLGAALFTSLVFVTGHFLKVPSEAFIGTSWVADSGRALEMMLDRFVALPQLEIRFLNLMLMSLLLCYLVQKKGTIWLAAGLHAGWVYIKRMNDYLFDINRTLEPSLWLGRRADHSDGLICTLLLIGLYLFFRNRG